MNKTLTINVGKFSLTLQLRDNSKSRKADLAPIVIDESKKQETLDSLDMDSLKERARAMRAIHAQG